MGLSSSKIYCETFIQKSNKKIAKKNAENIYNIRMKQYNQSVHGSKYDYMLSILAEYDLNIDYNTRILS
jgi:hypothetical protein